MRARTAARWAACVAIAAGVHAALLAPPSDRGGRGAPAAAAPATAPALDEQGERAAAARRERERLLAEAREAVAAGRMTLGEALVRLGFAERVEADPTADARDRDRALAIYAALLADVRGRLGKGAPLHEAIADAVREDGRVARYKRIHERLHDALAHGGGNCVALSTLAAALAADAAGVEHGAVRIYTNHVTPDVDGFRFGMAAHCRGEGVRVAAADLLDAYGRARAAGSSDPFAFPRSTDPCDDPGDVFGGIQLARTDHPPRARGAPSEAAEDDDLDCRRRPLMDEYDGDVEVLGAAGAPLGGVGVVRTDKLDLAGHASTAACFERRVAALPPDAESTDTEAFVFALADAALASEEAARVFALAGELDVAREYERRLGALRRRAAAPLEKLILELEARPPLEAGVAPPSVLAHAGRLLALGERGRAAMLLAAEKHRGYWELASLMTRPASQSDALSVWATKPLDVRVDVVMMLPCASEILLSQLATTESAEARALRAACEARVRAERAPCDARIDAPEVDRALLDALVARQRRARCR